MIPYEELVIALQTWRAKQGLPVGQLSGALIPPPAPPAPAPVAARTAPPVAPPKSSGSGPTAAPPPLAPVEDSLDVADDSLIEESHYENEGDDFAMNFGAQAQEGESTMIGEAPERPTEMTLDEHAPASRGRNEDW